jgi:uncharacterized protein (TIGR00251 family)
MADDEAVTPEFQRLSLTDRAGAVRIPVHVRPRSSRSAILGVREGALEVALTSPPVDGEANAELLKLLARALEVRRADIAIVVGASGRTKLLEVNGMSGELARERLRQGQRGVRRGE